MLFARSSTGVTLTPVGTALSLATAPTRASFDETALTVRSLRTDPVGVVLRADDPLAHRDRLRLAELVPSRVAAYRSPQRA